MKKKSYLFVPKFGFFFVTEKNMYDIENIVFDTKPID